MCPRSLILLFLSHYEYRYNDRLGRGFLDILLYIYINILGDNWCSVLRKSCPYSVLYLLFFNFTLYILNINITFGLDVASWTYSSKYNKILVTMSKKSCPSFFSFFLHILNIDLMIGLDVASWTYSSTYNNKS